MFGVSSTASDGQSNVPIEIPEDIFERITALCLALLTLWISTRPASGVKTFGYLRAEILGALVTTAAGFRHPFLSAKALE